MLDRRGFLKCLAGVAAGTLATPVVWKTIDDVSIWTQNWSWIPKLQPGKSTYVRTVSKMCPSAVATTVRLVDGRPVSVAGSPNNPLGGGGVSALAAAEVQMLYAPERVKRPLRRSSDGSFSSISWDEANALLAKELQKAKAAGSPEGITVISGDENGTINEVLSGLATQLGSDRFFMMPHDAQTTARAWRLADGMGRVGYDIPHSDMVLAIGADVLETWGTVVPNRAAWGKARPLGAEPSMRLVYAGPVESNTAIGADLWVPLKPQMALPLVLALLNACIQANVVTRVEDFYELRSAVAPWTAERLEKVAGVPKARFEAMLAMLLAAKKPVVIVGSDLDQGGSVVSVTAAFVLNALLGRINTVGGVLALPVSAPVVPKALTYDAMMHQDLLQFTHAVAKEEQKASSLVLFYDANPVYVMPNRYGIASLMKDATFKVSFSSFLDETALACDLVLPAALGLERYDDVVTPFATSSQIHALTVPVAEPLYEARPAGEVLMAVGAAIGLNLGATTFIELLEKKAQRTGAVWANLLKGDVYSNAETIPQRLLHMDVDLLKVAIEPLMNPSSNLAVALVGRRAFGTPTTAIPPFNLKTITDRDLSGDILSGLMNETTALRFGLTEGQKVLLSPHAQKETEGLAGQGSMGNALAAVIRLNEGVTNNTIALSLGFGHTAFTAYNSNKGDNAMRLVTTAIEPGTGVSMWNSGVVDVDKG